jgi:hypothetical protein
MNKHITKSSAAVFLLALFVFFNSCTVQYVAAYDENIKNEIIRIAGEVEMFYAELLETEITDRTYDNFKDKYLAIEVGLRTLLLKNKIRPLNEESTKQTEIALQLWLDDKEKHKTNNAVNNFIVNSHRSQFQRIFIAMAKGEAIKEE